MPCPPNKDANENSLPTHPPTNAHTPAHTPIHHTSVLSSAARALTDCASASVHDSAATRPACNEDEGNDAVDDDDADDDDEDDDAEEEEEEDEDEEEVGAVLTMASDAAVMDSSEAGAINLRTNAKMKLSINTCKVV